VTPSRAFVLCSALLAACGGGGAPPEFGADPDPSTLCLDSGCGTKTTLVSIPQAENIFFTDDGRLFVDGSTNVFEITRDGETFTATPIFEGTGNFGGMAQIGNVLYVTSFDDGSLYAAELEVQPVLRLIHDLDMSGPNGMVAGPDGELYINNGPLSSSGLPDPRMVRIKLDPADPMHVVEQADWITSGLEFPNGLARNGRSLFLTDAALLPPTFGMIKRVDIGEDGTAGVLQTIATFDSIPDDLSVVGDALLVAYYTLSAIALYGQDGALIAESSPLSFQNPSQVKVGRPPMFEPTDILVTEKGLVGDDLTPFGDVLSVFRPTP
jgi:hypothetical protein